MRKLCLILTAFAALTAQGVRTQSITQNAYTDFFPGELENVSLDNRGGLRAGPALEEIAVLDDSAIFSAVADADGMLYLGTGNKGSVFKLDPTAEEPTPELLFNPDSIMTRAMVLDADGNLYFGTSPEGAVYRLAPGGRPEVFFDPEGLYIWDLLFDNEGNLFVATGAEAKIYKLPPDFGLNDEPVEYFSSDRTHFTRMVWDANDDLIAGSGPDAYLYRITGEGEGDVLYSAGTEEIANVATVGEDIYFSTWHQDSSGGKPPANLAQLLVKFFGKPSEDEEEEDNGNGGASNAPSFLLKLDTDGFVSPIWSPGGANLQSMTTTTDGTFLIGSDQSGRIYSVQNADTWSLLNQAPREGEVSVILDEVGPDSATYIFTSNPAAVYRLGGETEETPSFTTEPIDAGIIARWGRLRPLGSPKLAEGVTFETRTGNAAEPDDTWSDWADLDEGVVASPPARFLQYRATLADDGALNGLTAYFGARNLAPVVALINIIPVGLNIVTNVSPTRPPLNPKELTSASKTAAALAKPPQENQKVVIAEDTGSISVAWGALDPNGDRLRFAVALQQDGEEAWITLADDLKEGAFSTPTRGFADGYYRFKVTASDAPSNRPGDTLTGFMISQPFLIDNTSPDVKLHNQTTSSDSETVLVFTASDEWGIITEAAYRLDGQPAVEAIPTDGLFDSNEEIFRLVLPELKPGTHSIVFEAIDELDNRGLAKATFEVEEK